MIEVAKKAKNNIRKLSFSISKKIKNQKSLLEALQAKKKNKKAVTQIPTDRP